MIVKTRLSGRYRRRLCLFLLIGMMLSSIVVSAAAQKPKKTRSQTRSISSSMPDGYTQVGNTDLCFNQNVSGYNGYLPSIDIQGKYESNYYGSTYDNCGYEVAMQVGNGDAAYLDCLNGTTLEGVKFEASVNAQSDLARVCYYVTNTNDEDVTISLGIHADVMIGDNDRAPIVRKIDTIGNTYGLALLDGNGAQLCVLFGAGLPGVTGISDYWFGGWSSNSSANEMVGNYYQGSNWMVENGSYDSGMGWCWKNRIIPAGETVVFSWLIGVGDVNLEPNSNFEVTPEDPEGWNDLSRLHVLALEGDYESPAGLNGRIEYAVEDSEEWIALTEMIESGSTFTGEVRAMFDPTQSRHTIRFRTVDQVGNTSLLPSIVYPDVAFHALGGVEEKTYTGEPIYQTEVTCDLGEGRYELKNYQNNVNAGTASFNIEGVFPYTIGRKAYSFTINPAPLTGGIDLESESYVYDGQAKTPDWSFTEEAYATLEFDKDYTFEWSNNTFPGTATLTVSGKGNYTGTLSQTFLIDKAPLTADLYEVTLPDEDISYDETTHGASIIVSEGVGLATITYQKDGNILTTNPSEPGSYDVYLEISDGTLYYGLTNQIIGSFTIYQFDETDWQNLQTLRDQLVELGWEQPWDLSQGAKSASSLSGLSIEQGHVVGLDLSHLGLTGIIPSAVSTFPTLKSLNLSGNSLSGNIGGLFVDGALSNLKYLDASNNKLTQVSPMLPSTLYDLNLNGQEMGTISFKDIYTADTEMVENNHPNLLYYDHQAQNYTSYQMFNLCNTDGDPCQMTLSSSGGDKYVYASENYWLYKRPDGDLFRLSCNNNHSAIVKMQFDPGDVNFDTEVNVSDLQLTVDYAVEQMPQQLFNFTAADIQTDDWVNVQDVVCIVNLLLDQDIEANLTRGARTRTMMVTEEDAEATLFWRGNLLILKSERDVNALDIAISDAKEVKWMLNDVDYDFSVSKKNGYIRIVHYSMAGKSIKAGETVLAEVNGNAANVLKAELVDKKAKSIKTFSNGTDTAIQEITSSIDVKLNADIAGVNILTNKPISDVQWTVYSIGGQMLGKGTSNLLSGSNTLKCNLTNETQIIVRLVSDHVNIIKKISITK